MRHIDMPSPETIAKFARVSNGEALTNKTSEKIYHHSRYLVRRERNYAKGLNSAGQPLSTHKRNKHPSLKGLNRKDYKREWEKLNR